MPRGGVGRHAPGGIYPERADRVADIVRQGILVEEIGAGDLLAVIALTASRAFLTSSVSGPGDAAQR